MWRVVPEKEESKWTAEVTQAYEQQLSEAVVLEADRSAVYVGTTGGTVRVHPFESLPPA